MGKIEREGEKERKRERERLLECVQFPVCFEF